MNRDPVGDGRIVVAVTPDPIDPASLMDFVADPAAGCVVVFAGTVRNASPDRPDVTRLDYEAYQGVAEEHIHAIVEEARSRWDLLRVAAIHRTGSLAVGETAVAVAVSSGHRDAGFPAASYIIDELKARVPIWKKEHWSGGAEWVAGA